jgi:hypothetical protein
MTLLNLYGNSSITIPVKLSLSKIVTLFFCACFMVNHCYGADRELQQQTEFVSQATYGPLSIYPLLRVNHQVDQETNQYKLIKPAIYALFPQSHLFQQSKHQHQQRVNWQSQHRLQLTFVSISHILVRQFVTRCEDTPPKRS